MREALAAEYLLALGHQVVYRRLVTPFAEVDIVTLDGEGRLNLIEVKGPWQYHECPGW